MTHLPNTALLVMDMQQQLLQSLPNSKKVIDQVAIAIAAARKANIPVIYIVIGFREGLHEFNPDNKRFVRMQDLLNKIDLSQWIKIEKSLEPINNEPICIKRRFSAFSGSDLEIILRSQGIKHLVLTGVITSGVILSTVTEAADKDYIITILSDACMDRDEELHRILMEKYFPGPAQVMRVEEWNKS